MRLAFAGTPEFAALALARLVEAGHDVALVLTQPDRRAGRGMQPVASPVKRYALERGLPLYQPDKLRAESVERLQAAQPQALVVAAYGLLLPQSVLDATPLGAWNIHASLLPRWRGAAPIQRALLAGDRQSGISIMKMDAGLDTGPVLARAGVDVAPDDDAGTLRDRLASLGADMIVAAIAQIEHGTAQPVPQPAAGATYAAKIDKRDTVLDWKRLAVELERAVRAFRPMPGASTLLAGEPLKIWRAAIRDGTGSPGEVLRADTGLVVACGKGALEILEVQRPGGRRMAASEFLRGYALQPGSRLG